MKTYLLTPAGFDALRTKLLDLGITLPSGADGVLSYNGIELKYRYDGSAALTLTVMKKPMLVPSSLIWEQVDKWIAG